MSRTTATVVAVASLACSAEGYTGDKICEDVLHAVASRTYACTGDLEKAKAAQAAFDDLTCLLSGIEDDSGGQFDGYYHETCIAAVEQLDCELVTSSYDDADTWLLHTDRCALAFGTEAGA